MTPLLDCSTQINMCAYGEQRGKSEIRITRRSGSHFYWQKLRVTGGDFFYNLINYVYLMIQVLFPANDGIFKDKNCLIHTATPVKT